MKFQALLRRALALSMFAASSFCLLQAQTTGVSKPSPDVAVAPGQVTDQQTPDQTPQQDSAQMTPNDSSIAPATTPAMNPETGPETPAATYAPPPPPPGSYFVPASTTIEVNAPLGHRSYVNPDDDIVTSVPVVPGQLAIGTAFRIRLDQTLSSESTPNGTLFFSHLLQPILQNGAVVIPAGSELRGRVMHVQEGGRFLRHGSLRLRPDEVVLPDGAHLHMHGQVVDVVGSNTLKTDGEGGIRSDNHGKRELAIVGVTTGVGAASGAVIAGPPGAIAGTFVGLGAGTTHALLQEHQANLPESLTLVLELTEPMSLTPVHQ